MAMISTLAVLGGAAIGFALYFGLPWRWFSYHPLLMLLAHLALASVRLGPITLCNRGRASDLVPVN
jgi:hypothetical protein